MIEFYLDEEVVIRLHDDLIEQTGGSKGIRDLGLLSSALNAPFQSFGGYEIYETVHEKAARLAYGLIQNHAFIIVNHKIP